jgi:RNA polymerase sigma factor
MQADAFNERVATLKNNEAEINRLVEEYKPFIAACAEKTSGRYMKYGEDDELSIAMMAFVEAVRAFDVSRGSFLSFSRNVIKRRIIDYYRKEKKHSGIISLSEYTGENGEEIDLSEYESIERYSDERLNELRKFELEELKLELEAWDISFFDLAKTSPKQDKTRKACKEAAGFILSRADILALIMGKKYLPMAEIEKGSEIPRKVMERSRKYIIALVLIAIGDYQYIRDYVQL